ncbi:MAG: homoserine dehydrogenase [Armatimonadetes bacterium]|nr:homoserine dehydrogenase [Armatimonadota bacterium]
MGKNVINVGFLGCGNVGAGTIKVLHDNAEAIRRKIGAEIRVKRVAVAHLDKARPEWVDRDLLTTDPADVIDDPEIDILAETIGGLNPAKAYLIRAMERGKHIVSANKELLAKEGHDLLPVAAERGLDFFFEGAVAGGIPIIRPLMTDLAANRIDRIEGIVNGTTNFILTKMAHEGRDFGEVLAEAQKLGYAEVDPTDDVEGYDAAYKLAILASTAFSSRVPIREVYFEGIRNVSAADIHSAAELGYVIKLLAIAKRAGDSMELRVHPAFVPKLHPLSAVNDVFNALFLHGDAVGDVMFYGRGAGSLPTGSAVAGDIMDIARNIRTDSTARVASTCFAQLPILPMDEVQTRYYIRMRVEDRPKVLAAVANVLGDHQVSIASVVQRETHDGQAEIVWLTHPAVERNMKAALEEIRNLPAVRAVNNMIRVED